ncbi:hypothetical protein V4V35_25465 [Bacillus infantis]|uniref:hypothetical protein n=1 Tax=Bacillus infantis TaxID=324767 RepID=UPI002FBEE97F
MYSISLSRVEVAVLIFHMNIMRKNVKKVFKKNYGKEDGKELLSYYDKSLDKLADLLESVKEGEEGSLDMDEKEMNVLSSFVSWYALELELTLDQADSKKNEDEAQLQALKDILEKLEQEKEEHED